MTACSRKRPRWHALQEKTKVARLAKVTGGRDCRTFSLASKGSRSHENTSHTFKFGSSDVVQNIDRTSPGRFPLSPDAAFVTNVGGSEDSNAAARADREERQRELRVA